MNASFGQRRLTMLLLAVFAGVSLLLAVVGIYGVIAYTLAQRTRELGIRRALDRYTPLYAAKREFCSRSEPSGISRASPCLVKLGAQEGDILRLVVGQGLGLTLVGVAIGIGGALALTRLMKSLLFNTSASDPATFLGIALLFVVVAFLASSIPARRAARIDPMMALRVG